MSSLSTKGRHKFLASSFYRTTQEDAPYWLIAATSATKKNAIEQSPTLTNFAYRSQVFIAMCQSTVIKNSNHNHAVAVELGVLGNHKKHCS